VSGTTRIRLSRLLTATCCVPQPYDSSEGFIDASCETAAARAERFEAPPNVFLELGEEHRQLPRHAERGQEVVDTREVTIG
jgi:hypothetical protein